MRVRSWRSLLQAPCRAVKVPSGGAGPHLPFAPEREWAPPLPLRGRGKRVPHFPSPIGRGGAHSLRMQRMGGEGRRCAGGFMRIGIVGFGFIGKHLYQRLMQGAEPGLSVAFVWNRSPGKIAGVPLGLILRDLAEATEKRADLIVEVAHPEVTRAHGAEFVAAADYLITSVTALADDALR